MAIRAVVIKSKELKLTPEQELRIIDDEEIEYASIIKNRKTGVESLIAEIGLEGRKLIRHYLQEETIELFTDDKTGNVDKVITKDFDLVKQIKGDVLYKHEHEKTIAELVMERYGVTEEEIKEALVLKNTKKDPLIEKDTLTKRDPLAEYRAKKAEEKKNKEGIRDGKLF